MHLEGNNLSMDYYKKREIIRRAITIAVLIIAVAILLSII